MNLSTEIKKALDYHIRGDLDEAGELYDTLLRKEPGHARIWHLAGVLSHQQGDLEKACQRISRAASITPQVPEYQVSLGAALKAYGRLNAARKALEKAVRLAPMDAAIINELGDIANAIGDYRQAVNYFTRALEMDPESAVCHFNLGLAQRNIGDSNAALISFREAVHLDSGLIEAHYAIGNLMQDIGCFDMAVVSYQRVLQLSPRFFEAHYNMGNAAKSKGDPKLAAECYRRTLEINPDFAEAYNNTGLLLKDEGRYKEAVSHFKTALGLKPQLVEAAYNLGVIAQLSGNHEVGLKWFQHALQIQPDYAPARWLWYLSLPILYQNPEEINQCRNKFSRNLATLIENTPLETAEDIEAAVEGVGSMTNFYLQYQGRNDRILQSQYGKFVCRVMQSAYPQWCQVKPQRPCTGGTKIRVGYVSSFMRAHTVGEFLAGWLEHHDHEQFEIYCYHIGQETDLMTDRFRNNSADFRQIGNNLEKAAQTILDDSLNILVFTDIGMNALATQLAALRLAPIQCKGWGHPVTTGLPTIDYYLSSDGMEPENAQNHYSECLIRLPNLALAYTPPALPEHPRTRTDFGLSENAFLCLNTQSLFKLLPQHDDIYPRIAAEVPGVQFAFLAHRDEEITQQFTARLAEVFEDYGLNIDECCRILPKQSFPDFLSLNLVSDVLLDSMEWSGGKTTLEAISCGLPVVTCPGKMMRGRHAFAMLNMLGLNATIARNKADYIKIVAALGRDKSFHSEIKQQIDNGKHKLYADSGCIQALEKFYRGICGDEEPVKIEKEDASFLVHPFPKQYHGSPYWKAVSEGKWEPDTFRIIQKYCSPNRCCIDLGAWIGPTTLYAANFARYVFAAEPDPIAAEQLKANLELNPHLSEKTTLFEGCIGSHSGQVAIGNVTGFGDSETSILFSDPSYREVVPAMTFNDFITTFDIEDCGFIKMDIEGAESLVLPDMVEYLRQIGPTLFISLHPHLFGNQADKVLRNIYSILSECYDIFHLPSGERIKSMDGSAGPIIEIIANRQPN